MFDARVLQGILLLALFFGDVCDFREIWAVRAVALALFFEMASGRISEAFVDVVELGLFPGDAIV